jgi:hypothetical protein
MNFDPDQQERLRACAAILEANAARLRGLADGTASDHFDTIRHLAMTGNDIDAVSTRLERLLREVRAERLLREVRA